MECNIKFVMRVLVVAIGVDLIYHYLKSGRTLKQAAASSTFFLAHS